MSIDESIFVFYMIETMKNFVLVNEGGFQMTEERLIWGLKRRDEKTLQTFIDHYAGLMKYVIGQILSQFPYLQEEVLDDAVLMVWQHIDDFDARYGSFKNWCASVAKYRAINAYKKEHKHLYDTAMTSEHEDIIASNSEEASLEAVETLLATLPPQDQRIFRQIFLMGDSYESVAAQEQLSMGALYNRISRGRKCLKQRKDDVL